MTWRKRVGVDTTRRVRPHTSCTSVSTGGMVASPARPPTIPEWSHRQRGGRFWAWEQQRARVFCVITNISTRQKNSIYCITEPEARVCVFYAS